MTDDTLAPEPGHNRLLGALLRFVRALRQAQVGVPADGTLVAAQALSKIGIDDEVRVRAALRSVLVSSVDELERFESLFPHFWQEIVSIQDSSEWFASEQSRHAAAQDGESIPHQQRPTAESNGRNIDAAEDVPSDAQLRHETAGIVADQDDYRTDPDGDPVSAAVYSPIGSSEPIQYPSGAEPPDDDLHRVVERFGNAIAGLHGRRWRRASDGRPDIRRALRRSVQTGGAVSSIPALDRKRSAVRAVFLVDVSRSVLDVVERRFLLRFLERSHSQWRTVRIFLFDTAVKEVTEVFDEPTHAAMVDALADVEAEWGGGTRIGHALEVLRHDYPLAFGRDVVVIIISDGLETGEINLLEAGMACLSARVGAVLWFNPLTSTAGYEPTCRGMKTALPYVNGLFPFSGIDDVDEAARQLELQGVHGRIGYRYDRRRSPPA